MPLEPIKHRLQNKNWLCRKKIKFGNWLERGKKFFLHFRIPGVTKREKTCFKEKKSRFFYKLIIKNVQNELLYNKKCLPISNSRILSLIVICSAFLEA